MLRNRIFPLVVLFFFSSCLHTLAPSERKPENTWFEKDGKIFGARADKDGPLGGGTGYKRIVIDGDYRIKDREDIVAALKDAKEGDIVFVDGDAEIDVTPLVFTDKFFFKIRGGVTLASDRGLKGSKGAILRSDNFGTSPLLKVLGPNVRITGLRIIGPDPKPRLAHHKRSFNPGRGDREARHHYYYLFPNSTGIQTEHDTLEVDNCELSGWSHAAVYLKGGGNHRIHHNYIHHNQRKGLGYGVCHGYGKNIGSLIEYNLFNYNRHSIAGTGAPGIRYEARNNVALGESLSHNFDMHGGKDRRDGTNIAGSNILIHHNTFTNPNVRPIKIRGIPEDKAEIYNNWFAQDKPGQQVLLPWPPGPAKHILFFNNAFGRPNPVIFK
jgi:hypothetical protein